MWKTEPSQEPGERNNLSLIKSQPFLMSTDKMELCMCSSLLHSVWQMWHIRSLGNHPVIKHQIKWSLSFLCPQACPSFIRSHHLKQCVLGELLASSARSRGYLHLLSPGKKTQCRSLRRQGDRSLNIVVLQFLTLHKTYMEKQKWFLLYIYTY